jgi:hypothetical protein
VLGSSVPTDSLKLGAFDTARPREVTTSSGQKRPWAGASAQGRAPERTTLQMRKEPTQRVLSLTRSKNEPASPAERSLRARLAAHALHAQRDPRETTAKGRAAFLVLQPQFLGSASPVEAPCPTLMASSPPRPAKHPDGIGRGWPDQQAQQPADLWHAEGRHLHDHSQPIGHFCAVTGPPCGLRPAGGRAAPPRTHAPASTR